MKDQPSGTRSRKPRDREQTRARIIEAAKIAFSQQGYAAANMRDIAAEADINVALIVRYFGSKEKLFETAVIQAFDVSRVFEGVDRHDLGKHIAHILFSEQHPVDMTAMILRASVDPSINPLTRELARTRMLEPLIAVVGGRNAERRAAAILALVTGVWFYRFILRLEPFAGKPDADSIEHIAGLIQNLVNDENEP